MSSTITASSTLLADEFANVVKLNVDEAPDIAERYGAQGIALLVLIREGAEVDSPVRAVPLERLRAWIEPELVPASAEPLQPVE